MEDTFDNEDDELLFATVLQMANELWMLLNNDEKDTGSTIVESKEDFLAMNEKSPKYLQIEVLEQYDFEYLNDTCPPFPLLTIKVMILHCPIRTMNNYCWRVPTFLRKPRRLPYPRQYLRQWTAKRFQSSQPSYEPPTAPQQRQPMNPHVCWSFRLTYVYVEANICNREPSTGLLVCLSQKYSSERC